MPNILSSSVILATYNGSRWLPEQLESLVSQTHPVDELIVIDDGSLDDTLKVIDDFRPQFASLKLVRNDANMGSTYSFAHGLELATGDITFFCDQDDIWLDDKIDKHLQVYRNNQNIQLVFSPVSLMDQNGKYLEYHIPDFLSIERSPREIFLQNLVHNVIGGLAMSFRTHQRPYITPLPIRFCHDHWIAMIQSILGGCYLIPKPLVRYRIHQNNQLGYHRGFDAKLRQVKKLFSRDENIEFFIAVYQHLAPMTLQPGHFFEEFAEAVNFHQRRLKLNGLGLRKIGSIISMVIHGDYQRYATQGKLSALRDLIN